MTRPQSVSLFALRALIGWHLLYEGLSKVADPGWTAAGYLEGSQGPLSGLFRSLAGNAAAMPVVDLANQWGLVLLGLALILGLRTRWAAILGAALLLLYYLCAPPWRGLVYTAPFEGNYLIVNKTLIEAAALLALAAFPSGKQYGLDLAIGGKDRKKNQK